MWTSQLRPLCFDATDYYMFTDSAGSLERLVYEVLVTMLERVYEALPVVWQVKFSAPGSLLGANVPAL